MLIVIIQVPAPGGEVGQSAETWIGFATVVATIILGILRQELAARRTAEILATRTENAAKVIEKKAEQTKQQIVEQVVLGVQEQKQATVVQTEEIKDMIAISAAAAGTEKQLAQNAADKAVYASAVEWRRYVDAQFGRVIQALDRVSSSNQALESATKQLQAHVVACRIERLPDSAKPINPNLPDKA